MKRVSVVGGTGTGKTTFGRELARIMDVPFVELDEIVWQPEWKLLEPELFRERVTERIGAPAWVVDGNYGGAGVRDLVWAKADTIIWLDFDITVIFRRLWARTTARIRDGKELWPNTGNRETIRGAFLSRDSLFVWALQTHRARRRNYPRVLELPQYAAATKLRFRTPAEADEWLEAQREAGLSRIHG
jgi:adenylate kinase family enzyme